MSSIEELKVIRVFRAFNTIIQLCCDRGCVIRHPSAVAKAMTDPAVYSVEDGLDYEWFLKHFVLTPDTAAHHRGHSGRHSKEEAGDAEQDAQGSEEMLQRATRGEWVVMRNAMRLSCADKKVSKEVSGAHASPRASLGEVDASAEASPTAKDALKASAPASGMLVFFSGTPTLTMKEVQDFREKALKKRVATMIIVTSKVLASVRRDVQEMSGRLDANTGSEVLRIQVFEEDALAFNVARHETTPRHEAMSDAEAKQFLAERRLKLSQLPRILETDPLVQYLGLQRGSIVKITRESKDSGPYEMYRQVI